MNKYIIICIALVVLIVGGVAYKYSGSGGNRPQESGTVREITLTAKKDSWKWDPEIIEADQGDKIVLMVINEDSFDHGIAIEAFGVTQRIPANGSIKTEFVVTQPGEFPFYCSVPCGSGVVDGKERGHFEQTGRLKVRAVVKVVPSTE